MSNPFMISSHAAVESWLAAHPPELAFDIGANEGGYTDLFLRHQAKKVMAFEPLPDYAGKLQARFVGDDRVQVHPTALGEWKTIRHNLSVMNCWTLVESSNRFDPVPEYKGRTFDVPFDFLDSGRFGQADFIKLDADGYEPAILRGAAKMIDAMRPPIMLELSYLPQELGDSCDRMVYDLFVRHGYAFVSMDGKTVERHHRTFLQWFPWNTSYDVLAVPVEKLTLFV